MADLDKAVNQETNGLKHNTKHTTDDIPLQIEHVPPPKVSVLKNQSATKMDLVKSIYESILVHPKENPVKEVGTKDGKWSQTDMTLMEYIFYKFLLVGFYSMFAIFRYFQYVYHTIKLKILNIYYNPSNAPQLIRQDVTKLNKIPKRLAAILEVKPEYDVGGGINGLLNDGSKLVCWTVSAGIKHLVLYDYDGLLQRHVEEFREDIYVKLCKYFGPKHLPKFAIKIPHSNKIYYNTSKMNEEFENDDDDESVNGNGYKKKKVVIEISLLSNRDGRETIVDLTKTMAELVSRQELKINDITMDLVDSELKQLVGDEPDLLLYFGPALDLQGYPPWQIRLTEFYWEDDNTSVTYSVFIRGLKNFAGAKMNIGK